jgi:hypothetical protein
MKTTIRKFGFAMAAAAALSVTGATRGQAQEFGEEPAAQPAPAAAESESWYRSTGPRVEKLTISQEKAIARGQQRMARLDAMRWYGFSNSRPTAAAMPYTTMYSPAWQQPGGRPFAWYANSRPVIVYTR